MNATMKQKLIGILAIGPRSIAPFIDMVVTQCQIQYSAKNIEDFPPMMLSSLPAPFYVDKPIDHQVLKQTISNALKKLEATGVDFIAMPCNTAHIYYDYLSASISVPLLNIIDEALANLPSSLGNVALFATRPTVEADLYQRGLRAAGVSCILNESWQVQVDEIIAAIESSIDSSVPEQMWGHLISQVMESGVNTIILGCTDLNVVSKHLPNGILMLDATQCLAKAVVQEYLDTT